MDLQIRWPAFTWTRVQLDDESQRQMFLSKDLRPRSMALKQQATVLCLCSTPYRPRGSAASISTLVPGHGHLSQPSGRKAQLLVDKEGTAPSLRTAQDSGILPGYASCLSYAAQLRSSRPAH